jgi:hypothetical protein
VIRDTAVATTVFVAVAGAFVGLGEETDLSNARPGQVVELFIRHLEQPADQPLGDWSTAFVNHVGYWSHYDQIAKRSTWPLPPLATCEQLLACATQRTMVGAVDVEPRFGDIFVQPAQHQAYVRAGIVIDVTARGSQYDTGKPHFDCTVIEGNSREDGHVGGPRVVRITRRLCPSLGDRFVRWADGLSNARASEGLDWLEWLEAA